MTAKTCSVCGDSKPLADFYKGQAKCKPCFLAHQRASKAARAGGAAAPRAAKAKKAAKGTKSAAKREASAPIAQPWSRPAGFGFSVQCEVDSQNAQTDILVKQSTKELGEQLIWLNQTEARELQSWLTEALGA